jgi:C1A family cysteine protease
MHLDLRQITHINAVRNQRRAGYYYAFVVCTAVEHLYEKGKGQRVILSVQDVHENLVHSDSEDYDGRTILDVLWFMKHHGCVRERSNPFQPPLF